MKNPILFVSSLMLIGGFVQLKCIVQFVIADTLNVGINYGRIADNLPPPTEVVRLLQSISISKVKIYDVDPSVLRAFANTGISFIVGIGNEDVYALTNQAIAKWWVQQNILSYLPDTQISSIAVGNEVFSGNDTSLMSNLLQAMKNLHACLVSFGLDNTITISTPHSLGVLGNSYPPSAGSFTPQLSTNYLKPLLLFLSKTRSPFMINAYPFFAYKANPTNTDLDFALFKSKNGIRDQNTGLIYYNMLDAQVDAIYTAMANLGFTNINVLVTETGWPSKGDMNEAGANSLNAQTYNANLIKRLASKTGTPMRPYVPLEAYIFALFNEDSKPGPTSERHYGLFMPTGTRSYDFGLDYPISSTLYAIPNDSSSYYHTHFQCREIILTVLSLVLSCFQLLMCYQRV